MKAEAHPNPAKTSSKTFEQKQFELLGKLPGPDGKQTGFADRLLSRWLQSSGRGDWVQDTEWARIMQEPLHARMLLYGILLSFAALVTWASFAEIDEVARGEGRVIPSRQLQTLQSLDGGLVEAILVREGQIVEQGDLLSGSTQFDLQHHWEKVEPNSLL